MFLVYALRPHALQLYLSFSSKNRQFQSFALRSIIWRQRGQMVLKYNAFQSSSLYLLLWKQFASLSINFSESQRASVFHAISHNQFNHTLSKRYDWNFSQRGFAETKNCRKKAQKELPETSTTRREQTHSVCMTLESGVSRFILKFFNTILKACNLCIIDYS